MTGRKPETYLLTPGPLTTRRETREALLKDWGSRDSTFIEMNARIRRRLVEIAGGADGYTAVPVQGSGTFAVEAMVGTFLPRAGKLLVLVNGAYGRRIVEMCRYLGRAHAAIEWPEDRATEPLAVERRLVEDETISHVVAVQCETTSGILNPVAEIAAAVKAVGRRLLVDAMSAFGALPLDAGRIGYDALAASSNKCLEGVPGFGFVVARLPALAETAENAHSLSLDLHAQWTNFEKTGQWRFTPPTHVIAAFDRALALHEEEGGGAGRLARYGENCRVLVAGMRALGFETLLPDRLQAPIIVTFRMPADPRFDFARFYDRMRERGFILYPGKVAAAPSFRIGCIGALDAGIMRAAVDAARATLAEMGIASGAPAAPRAAT